MTPYKGKLSNIQRNILPPTSLSKLLDDDHAFIKILKMTNVACSTLPFRNLPEEGEEDKKNVRQIVR
jgi:hypothetical protein